MEKHWRQVFLSMMDGILNHWKETQEDVAVDILNAFDLQNQCEMDDIDHDHYMETQGA